MFVYQADTYCDSCGEDICRKLAAEGNAPDDPSEEYSYDSDDYPKHAADDEETDGPDHCASYGDCLEPIDLGDYGLADDAPLFGAESRKIGALLSECLTDYGVSYLREMMTTKDNPTPYQVALYNLWRDAFSDYLSTDDDGEEY